MSPIWQQTNPMWKFKSHINQNNDQEATQPTQIAWSLTNGWKDPTASSSCRLTRYNKSSKLYKQDTDPCRLERHIEVFADLTVTDR